MTRPAVVESMGCSILVLLLVGLGTADAQQLEPRAYSPAPTGLNFIGIGILYSSGGVVTDPSLPIENVRAHVYAVPPYYGRTFGLFGRLASATLATPYAWAHAEGDVQDTSRSVDRSGFLDPQLRIGFNLLGCPALTPQEFVKRKPGTSIGASISISAPFGQYDSSKLINLGTNRWAGKPELGLSQPLGDWIIELYAGVWLFGDNSDFLGGQVRKQDPLATFQTHLVYNFSKTAWAAADFTYYDGGATTVGGQAKDDRQSNTRGGLTLSVPFRKTQSFRLTWAQGVSTRVGSSFQTVGARLAVPLVLIAPSASPRTRSANSCALEAVRVRLLRTEKLGLKASALRPVRVKPAEGRAIRALRGMERSHINWVHDRPGRGV